MRTAARSLIAAAAAAGLLAGLAFPAAADVVTLNAKALTDILGAAPQADGNLMSTVMDSAPLKAIRGTGPGALRDFLGDLPKDTVTFNKPPRGMIDFILASPAMAGRYVAKSYRVLSGSIAASGSDHNPVLGQFDLRGATSGPSPAE